MPFGEKLWNWDAQSCDQVGYPWKEHNKTSLFQGRKEEASMYNKQFMRIFEFQGYLLGNIKCHLGKITHVVKN